MQNVAALKVRQQTDPCPLGNTTYKSGAANHSYLYDANGNLQSGAGRSLTFNPFNMPQTVTLGTQTSTFGYGPGLERLTKTVTNGAASETTLYIEGLYERRTSGASTTQRYYVPAGDRLVAVAVDTGAGPVDYSVHTDRLGSMDVIANSARLAVNDLRFDAWGLRTDGTATASLLTPRGYTGHELDSDSGLINMNARLYDPLLGRFVSADTVLPDPFDLQSVNRYSYALNNPFRYTDPSGHEYIGVQNGVAAFNDGTGSAGMVATYNMGSGEYSFADGSRIDAQGNYFASSSYGVTLYVNTATNWADGTQWANGVGSNYLPPPSNNGRADGSNTSAQSGSLGTGSGTAMTASVKTQETRTVSDLDLYGTPWDDIPLIGGLGKFGAIGVAGITKWFKSTAAGMVARFGDNDLVLGLNKSGSLQGFVDQMGGKTFGKFDVPRGSFDTQIRLTMDQADHIRFNLDGVDLRFCCEFLKLE